MSHLSTRIPITLCLGALLFTAGCDDPKARITLLEEDLDRARQDLNAVQGDLARTIQDRDKAMGDVALLKQQNQALQGKLTEQPDLPENWTSVPGGAMTSIPGAVLFDSGQAKLRRSSFAVLGELVATIQQRFPNKDVYVFGHTDSEPIRKSGWKDNYELSCQRSLAVVRYFSSKGLNESGLVACGWGEHKPAVANATTNQRQQNRRVEIFAVDPIVASTR